MSKNNSVNNDHGFIGVGTPYFYPEDGEAFFLGNPVSFTTSSSAETVNRPSKRIEDAGAALDSRTSPNPTGVKFTTDTFSPLTWAMAMMGEAAEVTTTPVVVADEAVKAKLNGYAPLANADIDPATVQVSNGGIVVDAANYTVNTSMGLLQIHADAGIAADTDLTINYTTLAVTKTNIDSNKVTSFKGKVVIDGRNEVTGKRAKITFPNLSLAVGGDFDWFSDDYNTVEMSGTAAKGSNGESPVIVSLYGE